MKVTATRAVYVETTNGKVMLNNGQSTEVDGRRYRGHAFIEAGYLVAEEEPKPKRKPKADPAPEADDAEADDGEE
jgi:hypothetical protein